MIVHSAQALVLNLHDMVEGALGIRQAKVQGDKRITLKAGRNEVDDAFWSAWKEQNKGSALLSSFTEEPPKKEDNPMR